MVDKQGGQNPKTGRKDELKVNLGFYTARLLYDLFAPITSLNSAQALRLYFVQGIFAQTLFCLLVDSSATAWRQMLIWATRGHFFDEKTTLVAKNQQETSLKRRNPTMKASRTQEV